MAKKTSEATPGLADPQAGAGEAQDVVLEGRPVSPDGGAGEAGATAPGAENAQAELRDVNEIIRERGLPAWKGAALCRHAGWAPGKCVGAEEFEAALAGLESRPMGGGR